MARKKQYIRNSDPLANQRIQRAIPKLRQDLGMGKKQATAVAIRMESVGQLGMGGDLKSARQRKSGATSLGAFAVAQVYRNRQPKKTVKVNTKPIQANSVGDYATQYRRNVPLMFTMNTKKPRKK